MKKIFFAIFLFPFLTNAQITSKVKKVVPIITQRSFYLNGDFKPPAGSQSRVNYTIDLPPNTIEWYYMVSVTGGQTENKEPLNLVQQLEKLLTSADQSAIDPLAIESPAGAYPCAVYLMNQTNAEAFLQKVDFKGGNFSYILSGTRENIKNGVVQIKDAIYGTHYLGFKDPGGQGGITIRFEAAAIVEELQTNNSEWSVDIKEKLYHFFFDNIKGKLMEETDAKDIAACMIFQLSSSKTPGDYYTMSQMEKDSFLATAYKTCSAKYEEPKGPEYERASNYGNLGWKEYEKGNIDSAMAYHKMSIALDSSLAMVKANLGLLYLVKDDPITAAFYYRQALDDIRKLKLTYRRKEYLASVIRNLDEAVKKYPGIRGVVEVRGLFEGEMRKY